MNSSSHRFTGVVPGFYRATAKPTHGIAVEILSVCLSLCPSVKRVNCDKTKAPSERSSIMTNNQLYELSNESKEQHMLGIYSKPQSDRFSPVSVWCLEENLLQSFFMRKLSAAE